jgi:hypothetical protein
MRQTAKSSPLQGAKRRGNPVLADGNPPARFRRGAVFSGGAGQSSVGAGLKPALMWRMGERTGTGRFRTSRQGIRTFPHKSAQTLCPSAIGLCTARGGVGKVGGYRDGPTLGEAPAPVRPRNETTTRTVTVGVGIDIRPCNGYRCPRPQPRAKPTNPRRKRGAKRRGNSCGGSVARPRKRRPMDCRAGCFHIPPIHFYCFSWPVFEQDIESAFRAGDAGLALSSRLPTAWGSFPTAWGSLPAAWGSFPAAWGSLPTARGSFPTAWGSFPAAWGSLRQRGEASRRRGEVSRRRGEVSRRRGEAFGNVGKASGERPEFDGIRLLTAVMFSARNKGQLRIGTELFGM